MSLPLRIKEYILRRLAPLVFAIGLLAGFLYCRHWGEIYGNRNPFKHFVRFYQAIGPSSAFYPSARQQMAICKSRADKSDILVVIGGSSTFLGVGQPVEEIWSRHLEENLGSGFVVVNLAQRGNSATGGAESVAEALLKEGYKVIYIANTLPPQCGQPDGSDPYAYIFWNAYYRGLLFPWPARDHYFAADKPNRARRADLRMRARFDRLASSEDLWNTLCYSKFSTVWDPITYNQFWLPRKKFHDEEGPPLPVPERFAADVDHVIKGLKDVVKIVRPDRSIVEPTLWNDLERQIDAGFPPELRPRSIVVVMSACPYYVRKLTDDEQKQYRAMLDLTVDKFRAGGVNSLELGSHYDDIDYKDLVHLVPSGGRRVANDLTPEVQRIAHELYEK